MDVSPAEVAGESRGHPLPQSGVEPAGSDENFRAFFQTLDDMIFVGSPDGGILFSNPAASRKLGYSLEELLAMRLIDLHPAELRPKAEEILGAMLRGERETCPLPLETKSGVRLLVETRVWPGKWDGKDCLFGLCRDMTELNRTTRLLEESEGRFRRVADTAPVFLWETDQDALCSYVNKPWLDFTGRKLEQELGNGWADNIHPDDLQSCTRTYRLAYQAQREFKMEYRLRRADGEFRWLQDHGVPRFTPDGSFLGFTGSCLDINEIKQTKQDREELLGRLLKIAGRVPGVIYQYRLRPDGTSCFPFASEAIRDIYRVTPQEVREDASKVFANLHPADSDGVVESIQKSAQDLTPWQHEYRVKFADGTVRQLYGDAVPQREEDGSVLWHGFITDITERKQQDEDLRQLAERLSLATKAGQVGIWDWDVGNDRLVWDDHMYRQYGITRNQFAGAYEAWTAGLHPDDRERGDAEIHMALRGEKDFNTEFRVVWPDGSIHHIRAMALVQRNAAGEPLHLIGTNWDITDQERLDNELRESAAYARSLIEVNLDPLVTISVEGKITDVNEATVLATGLPREQLVGADFSECFTEPDKARAGYREAFTEGFVRDYPLALRHASGRTADVLYNASVYRDAEGNVLGVFAAARDITERKRAEAVVLQNVARAEELARLKSRFVSMASHELRTPIANILLACDLLKNFGGAMPAERSEAILSGLMAGVTSMVRTLDDLLLAGKIEEGKLPYTPARFALLGFLKRCCLEVQPDLTLPSRIEIGFRDAGLGITADERLLHHVLKNLLENALKYSPPDTKVELGVEVGPGSLTFSVLDRGIGVPEAERKFLFDAFSRASNVGDRPGSGLGLFIAQKCAQAHGGRMRYAPQPSGSVFSVAIPLSAPAGLNPVI